MSEIRYRPSIDGMRAIAVVSVLLFHLHGGLLSGGFVGVDIFFVISGYLITTIVYAECRAGDFSFLRFYQRRVARIFPVFFLVSLSILIVASVLYTQQDFASAGALSAASALSAANLKLMVQGNYFAVSLDAQPFLHYWSLSLEEQFYLFLPMVIFAAQKLRLSREWLMVALGAVALSSLAACIILTRSNPTWAFYLLPTRVWELLAGSLLALESTRGRETRDGSLYGALSLTGLVCVLAAVVLIHEGDTFPGYVAAVPVMGTALLIGRSHHPRQLTERLLSFPGMVSVGKASYSLYLWHWPVYCFIDYSLYSHRNIVRALLKIGITAILAASSYLKFEKPSRRYLNQPSRRVIVFTGFTVLACFLVATGLSIRSSNYIDASVASVGDGGIVFNPSIAQPVVVLMGDSNASMYGRVMKDIARETNLRVHVISVAAGDPFPDTELYRKSLQFLARAKPTITVFVAAWEQKIGSDHEKLKTALSEMLSHTKYVILITQPPILPESATREAIRQEGLRPIFEGTEESSSRKATNAFLLSLENDRVHILNVESLFMQSEGEIRFVDSRGGQLYQDTGHLSGLGARLVGALLTPEIYKLAQQKEGENLSTSQPGSPIK
ncbi:MAG: acyltransferase family protein [Pyrinomonadaceae bacterium]